MANSADLDELFPKFIFTPEDEEELRRAKSLPITFDEDCPETTPQRAVRFRRVNPTTKSTAN